MATVILGLGHKARHGKDFAAQAIIEARGHDFDIRRYALADALKQEVNAAAEKAGGMFALYLKVKEHSTAGFVTFEADPDMSDPLCPLGKHRTLLQWWGTEFRRKKDNFYWVRLLKQQIEQEKPQFALITDVRFLTELSYVKAYGGHTIKVERLGFNELAGSAHSSENELNNVVWDYEISVPDGDLEGLRQDAVSVFDMVVDSLSPVGLLSDLNGVPTYG